MLTRKGTGITQQVNGYQNKSQLKEQTVPCLKDEKSPGRETNISKGSSSLFVSLNMLFTLKNPAADKNICKDINK